MQGLGLGSQCLTGTELSSGEMDSPGGGRWLWLQDEAASDAPAVSGHQEVPPHPKLRRDVAWEAQVLAGCVHDGALERLALALGKCSRPPRAVPSTPAPRLATQGGRPSAPA